MPLIFSSGPEAFHYVFTVPGASTALEYLHAAFVDGAGEFGWRNHVVAELDGAVVAAGAGWSGASNVRFAAAAARQILRHYGLGPGAGVIARGLRVESVIQPPGRRCWYVAHLGVEPEVRSRGIGERLVGHLLDTGRSRRCSTAGLDVAATNPRAQALYQRLGFVVMHERRSSLANAQATVPSHRRMSLTL